MTSLPQWRQHLHQHPETAFNERATARFVADTLAGLGFEVVEGVGGTGVVGSLTRGRSGPAIGLRADMDALPIREETGLAYTSREPGTMHACGHDGHMTMVLGAAQRIAQDSAFDGTLRVVFQPAEEPGRGAQAMIDDGLFDRFPVDAMVGLHNMPGIPAGHLHVRPGGIMASEDNFEIVIHGRGGHAATPDVAVDPLVIGAEIVLALQTVVARNVDPVEHAVLSCTQFHTDGARNAIPGTVTISGDTRSFTPAVQELLEERIRAISAGVCAAHGARCEVSYTKEFAPTINDATCTQAVIDAATTALGAERVTGDCPPMMPSEDFGVFARHVPACFAFLGNGIDSAPLHSRGYDFNDDILAAGVEFYVQLARGLPPARR